MDLLYARGGGRDEYIDRLNFKGFSNFLQGGGGGGGGEWLPVYYPSKGFKAWLESFWS